MENTVFKLTSFDDFAALRLDLIDRFDADDFDSDTGSLDMALLEWAFDHIEPGMDETAAQTAFLEWALESTNCASCHAPSGLIYNRDIAAKFADWWDDIDDTLAAYRDATDESFAPETCGALVWFAVEWRAQEWASRFRDMFEQDSDQ